MNRHKLCRIQGHTFVGSLLSRDAIVLDLGANRGAFSLETKRRFGCEVHAAEPTPDLAGELRAMGEVAVYEAAITACGSDLFFKVDPKNSESSSVVSKQGEGVISVPGMTLDSLLRKIGKVDLIKMDVEGSEIEILATVSEDLIRNVNQITVEFHDFKKDAGFTHERYVQVCDRMGKLGFESIVMSYRTKGDVLFLNSKNLRMGPWERLFLEIKGRWIAGFGRSIKRIINT